MILGVTATYYDFANQFLPGADGDWFFANMDDLRLNAPQRYQRSELAPGEDRAVKFSVLEWGASCSTRWTRARG